MRTAQQFMLMVIVALVVAAVVLSPGRDERAAVLASEGRHREAIALLERQLSSAPNDPDLLAALGRSYAALGEVHRAIEAFDAYLAKRPDDLVARESEAELLLQSGMIDRYLEALARVVAAQPSPGRVTQLIELFRLHGRAEDELAALQAYASKAMLGTPQLERLGAILADRGNWREARNWLELADQKAPPDASAGRLLLLEVLIRNNEGDRVDERAQVWMKAWRSPFLCGKLILRLAQSGFSASASGLAVKYAELMPDETFEMVGLLVAQGRQDIARQMLVRWADRETKSTGPQLRAFVQASAQVGDVRGPLVKLAQLVRSDSDSEALGELIDGLANTFGKPVLAAIRPLLSDEVLHKQPLFAAELSLFEGNREMARWFLNGIEPAELSPERSANWLALLHRVETDADVVKRLTVLWNDGRLPPELVPDFANEAMKLGQMRTHDLIWSSARQ
jgi:tetratricopeptide (TPR) repeat protein